MVWLVTFTCYGTHLPGDPRGSRDHVRQGERRFIPPNPSLQTYSAGLLRARPYSLITPVHRQTVLNAIVSVCRYRDWPLSALHIRPSHVHGVVASPNGSKVLQAWKVYATRALRSLPGEPHTRYIGQPAAVPKS